MSNTYRLFLLEDDKATASAISKALNKQELYLKPIEIRTFSYAAYEMQLSKARNSTREIIVFGGRENLNFEPDATLLKSVLAQQDRTHVFVVVPSLESPNVLRLWHPGVSGILERNHRASAWLIAALQRLQRRQQSKSAVGSKIQPESVTGFFGHIRAAFFSLFV